MNTNEKVAVEVHLQLLANSKKPNFHAARLRELGLTAYGCSKDEAQARLRRMLGEFIEAHRRRGTLKERFDRSGLKWCALADYKGKLPVVDVSRSASSLANPGIATESSWHQEKGETLATELVAA